VGRPKGGNLDIKSKFEPSEGTKPDAMSRVSRASTAKPRSRYSVGKLSTKSQTQSNVMIKRQL